MSNSQYEMKSKYFNSKNCSANILLWDFAVILYISKQSSYDLWQTFKSF